MIRRVRSYKKTLIAGGVALVVLYMGLVTSPSKFPVGTLVSIEHGMTLSQIAELLEHEEVIKSPLVFTSLVMVAGGGSGVLSGDYFFEKDHSVFGIARRLIKGIYGLTPMRVTLPEGATVSEMADILARKIPDFDADAFRALAEEDEGFLFPDTYLFVPNISEEHVYRKLRSTFDEKIAEIDDEFEDSPWSVRDIVIMASILEEEARTTKTRRMIAGILWERIDIGMPLQVDAVFPYINGKNTFELTLDDLKVDSPYNTYKYKGLPVGPITNPGLDSILAALNPIASDYLFYLSDMSGTMHYAEDFERHKINKARYLR